MERLLENNAAKNPEEEQEKEVEEGQENDVQQKDTAKANIFDDQFS